MNRFALALLWLFSVGSSGCASLAFRLPPPPPPPTPPGVLKSYDVVRVFFATDRDGSTSPSGEATFGRKRASTTSYGSAYVSIPRKHVPGELEEPSMWRFEIREDPNLHVVLLSTTRVPSPFFFANLSERIREDPGRSAFIFVHGYNVSFEEAARRTAQIAHDVHFSGAPIFYSWPSQANTAKYTVDEANVEWAQANLRRFLLDSLEKSGAENIYLIAHSMGTRALTRAVTQVMADHPHLRTRLKEVILAAPDIDREVFLRDIAPPLVALGGPVTLYASGGDIALAASRKVHGEFRAGDTGDGLAIYPGMETIDATGVATDFFGHSYFADAGPALDDLATLILRGVRAAQRTGLESVSNGGQPYWKLKGVPKKP